MIVFRCLITPKHIFKNIKKKQEKIPIVEICDGIVHICRVRWNYQKLNKEEVVVDDSLKNLPEKL